MSLTMYSTPAFDEVLACVQEVVALAYHHLALACHHVALMLMQCLLLASHHKHDMQGSGEGPTCAFRLRDEGTAFQSPIIF